MANNILASFGQWWSKMWSCGYSVNTKPHRPELHLPVLQSGKVHTIYIGSPVTFDGVELKAGDVIRIEADGKTTINPPKEKKDSSK